MKTVDELWQIIAKLGLELHPDRMAAVATKIETLGSMEQLALVKSSFGPNVDKSLIAHLDGAWRAAKTVRPREIAAALRAASATAALHERHGTVELVWTGPSTGMVPVRQTEQVLCEVIESARSRLFIVSFVAYEVGHITKALQDAAGRRVRVDVLLESSIDHGGNVSVDSVKMMKDTVPSANVYVWAAGNTGKESSVQPAGSVHAKCAVADGRMAFITSANLSRAAMERNMELGVLVRGGHLPVELHSHLDALVATKIVELV
ncbi:PLD-like domain-containing protein [Desulfacinum infernum DSM 9756]|uniref:PLD-like domain-containing protein n=1 Tax=Desulfacinum infernum DSM 9756 TaxID=1121391 RepID=A0A1M5J8B4_9BACT|nr:DISARM system phospholipase D-like protein DrmC [Desulfacinum infernum]SHG36253.1 PLD-like domain-containing protein [Desulfacinum infernum DSM 9756]